MITRKKVKKSILKLISPIVMFTASKLEFWEPSCRTLRLLGNYLVFKDNLTNSDLIVVLGGGSVKRVHTAVRLYKKGFALKLLIYKNISINKLKVGNISTTQEAVSLGVKAQDIFHEDTPRNTADEAKILASTLLKQGFSSAIVVTDAFHTRRAHLLFQYYTSGLSLRVCFCHTGSAQFNPNKWWHKNEDTENLISEYLALAVVFLRLKIFNIS